MTRGKTWAQPCSLGAGTGDSQIADYYVLRLPGLPKPVIPNLGHVSPRWAGFGNPPSYLTYYWKGQLVGSSFARPRVMVLPRQELVGLRKFGFEGIFNR
jgi:hypothetical protein